MTAIRLAAALGLLSCAAVAQTTWTSFADRRGHAMATTATGGVVMFGGESVTEPGELLGDTLRLSTNNQTWTEPGVSTTPPPTGSSAMASTTIGGTPTYVMFGGTTPTGIVARTWRYSGTGWGDVTSAMAPLARSQHAMVTNTTTGAMFLFGGFDGTVAKNDTWEFTPPTDTWTERIVPGAKPSVRRGHCMAYHPGTDRVYVFGGTPFLNDLWAFDGNTNAWTQITPASALPPGRRFASMSYLEGTGTLIVFGGLSSGGVIRNDTWSYDPSSNQWTQVGLTNPPPVRYEHATAPDNTGDNLVLLGGTNALPPSLVGTVIEGTWLFSSITLQWFLQIPSPSARDGAAMSYDSVRNRHVVFGGRTAPGAVDLNETWEIDGLNWRQRSPSSPPAARSDAGMAFDAARNVTVLFGGRDGGGDRNDTWEWNGTSWTLRALTTNPPNVSGTQPVYDSQRRKVWVLVGSEMWSFDGTNWFPSSAVPSARTGACYAVDSQRNRLVMFGGNNSTSTYFADTWEWDGQWMLRSPSPSPTARTFGAMTYHAASQRCILHGGFLSPTAQHADTWTWDGTQWVAVAPIVPLSDHVLTYDPVRAVAVLFGGYTYNGTTSAYYNYHYEWNGSTWSLMSPPGLPPARSDQGMAYDVPRDRIVMFGGANGGGLLAGTRIYDGTTWTQAAPTVSPVPRYLPAMVFDAITQKVLLFGGNDGSPGGVRDDTWLWDGSNWASTNPLLKPTPRAGAALFRFGSRTLLWGGNNRGTYYNDMWEWTGTSWIQLSSIAPSARTRYGSAYDTHRDRVVMFGGQTASGPNAETWEWNGGAWLQRFPGLAPSPRTGCKLTFDESRRRVVLYGGANGASTYDDTWEWDGTNWTQRTPTAVPPGSSTHDLTFDKARKLSVAFGSFGTWDYGAVKPAAVTTYGAGCPSSASVPASAPFALKIRPWTGAWIGEPFEMEFEHAPLGIGLFLWGFDYTNSLLGPLPVSLGLLGIGPANCYLRNSFDVIEVFLGTTFTSSILVNASPALLGLRLYGQGAFFDALLPGIPVVTTNGGEFVVGQK